MRLTTIHRERFNASHVLDERDDACGSRLHGHDWYAEITFISPKGNPVPGPADYLRGSILEIDEKHLNDMLPAVPPTAGGVAVWLFERLKLDNPGLLSVTVGFTDHAVTVED